MTRAGKILVSTLLTVLIGYLLYRGVPDWGQAWRVMIQANLLWVLGGIGFVMIHMLLRALRWGVLLSRVKETIPYRHLLSLTLVKYVINIIPPRSGEVVASVALARKENIPVTSVIAASLFERICDSITVFALFGIHIITYGHLNAPNSEIGRNIMVKMQDYSIKAFIALGVCVVILAALMRYGNLRERIPGRLGRILSGFLEGFRALEDRRTILQAALLSVAIWLVIIAQIWFMLRAYLPQFPFSGTILVMVLSVVGISIPTPAGVGGYQFFMTLTLTNFFGGFLSSQDPHSQAAGISNGCYLASLMPVIGVGLICLYYEGLSFRGITRISEQTPDSSRADVT